KRSLQQFIGGVRAHAARTGALVRVEDTLVIACRHERRIAFSIRENDEREFVALEGLLQEDSLTPGSQFILFHHACDKIFRGGEVRRQKDSLAGAHSVCLDDYRESHREHTVPGSLRGTYSVS